MSHNRTWLSWLDHWVVLPDNRAHWSNSAMAYVKLCSMSRRHEIHFPCPWWSKYWPICAKIGMMSNCDALCFQQRAKYGPPDIIWRNWYRRLFDSIWVCFYNFPCSIQKASNRDAACQTAIFAKLTEIIMSIYEAPVPVIAKVNGLAAAAGCQLVASCDMVICTDKSSFSTPGY